MAVNFQQIIAGVPPVGGDTGAQFANKINSNFDLVNDNFLSKSQNLSSNGYTYIGALLIQWGTIDLTTTDQTFSFPLSFQTEVYGIWFGADGYIVKDSSGSYGGATYNNLTLSGFTAKKERDGVNKCYYLVFGK